MNHKPLPSLAEVKFDFSGYKNYCSCNDLVSERIFEEYLKQNHHPRTKSLE